MDGIERAGPAEDGRYGAAFEHASDAMLIADDEGRYLDANPAAAALFGVERAALVGRRIEEFAASDYDYDDAWSRFMDDAGQRGQFPLRRPDGSVRVVEYAATRDVREDEHLSVLRDVTERIEREAEMESRLERLDRFASMVSHDLRNPLNVAMGRLDQLHETGDAGAYRAARDALEQIERITDELLTLARRDDAGEEGARPVDLDELARSVWERVDTKAARLSVAAGTVTGRPGQLELLLANLFRNAVGHGGPDVTVRVEALPDGFAVEDTGVGIPSADRERVLEAGYSTGYAGSGVGLTIVEQMATANGYDLAVGESEAGGARFEFRSSPGSARPD